MSNLTPRNPNKPFMEVGKYHVFWYDKNFKHIKTEPSDLNRIGLEEECYKRLSDMPKGYSFAIGLITHNSAIKHNGIK